MSVRGMTPTIYGTAAAPDNYHLEWIFPAILVPDRQLDLLDSRSGAESDLIPTFGASQILVGINSAASGGAGVNVFFYLRYYMDDQATDFCDSSLFPITVVSGIQRFNVNENEYGPIPPTALGVDPRSVLIPICCHFFTVTVYTEADPGGGVTQLVDVTIERMWNNSSTQGAVS